MLVGMGTVFVFLTLLVMATRAMSALITHFYPPVVLPDLTETPGTSEVIVEEEIAAISIAMAKHLNKPPFTRQAGHQRDKS